MVENAAQSGFRGWALALALAGFCLSAAAGEKIEIVGEGVQLPKKKTLLDERISSFDILSDKPDISGGFAPPPVVTPGSAARELIEEYDRRKNWIYQDPRELDRRATGLDKLHKKEESTNPLEPRQEHQSVLERFLTERKRKQEENRELARENRVDPNGSSFEERYRPFMTESAFSGFETQDMEDREFRRELSLGNYLTPGLGARDNDKPADRYDRNYFNFQTLADRAQVPQTEADFLKQEEARSEAFQKLLQPRSITPSIAGVVDPIAVEADPSRQAVNPIIPGRPDPLDFGRRDDDSGYNSPAFTANAARTTLPSLNRSTGLDSFDVRAAQPAVSVTPPASLPAPASSAPAFDSSSFTLEIPKRKF